MLIGRGRWVNVIDDQNLDRSLAGYQLQPELPLQRPDQNRSGGPKARSGRAFLRLRAGAGTRPYGLFILRIVDQLEIVFASKSRFIHDWAVKHPLQVPGQRAYRLRPEQVPLISTCEIGKHTPPPRRPARRARTEARQRM